MEVVDFSSRWLAARLKKLDDLQMARDALETQRQLDGALAVLGGAGDPIPDGGEIVLTDALDLAVDALCNLNRTSEAVRLADETLQRMYDLQPNRWRFGRAPRTLSAFRAARVRARAIELDGDPDDAMRRSMALYMRLSKQPHLSERDADRHRPPWLVDPRPELVLMLRDMLSAAKREGSVVAGRFAEQAQTYGDRVAVELQSTHPATTASYLYRAALARRAFGGARAREEVVEMLERSLAVRPSTPRKQRSVGMACGELLVQRGERERGAQLLTETTERFGAVLPRHRISARQHLVERDLWREAA